MKLLVVEDDKKIGSFIAKGLRENGFVVDLTANGTDGLHLATTAQYDAAVLDIMLPGMDGIALLENLRAKRITIPVLILSARHTVDDRVRGLQAGGDDYLTKPFSFTELLARIQALLRRAAALPDSQTLTVGDLRLDLLKREVTRGRQQIPLQSKEFTLLEYLMRNPGRIVTKTAILENVYDYNFDPQTNVVDVLVCRLRNKIEKDFPNRQTAIQTIRGMGYVLKNAQ
ncbi:MAG: response regulator transcription factor [Verrucomicrobiales bacterium]|jgi:DNA-binding response OmpR family regulator|nr:response regulator transcription factor [Verrucomicrobiales bacterium]